MRKMTLKEFLEWLPSEYHDEFWERVSIRAIDNFQPEDEAIEDAIFEIQERFERMKGK